MLCVGWSAKTLNKMLHFLPEPWFLLVVCSVATNRCNVLLTPCQLLDGPSVGSRDQTLRLLMCEMSWCSKEYLLNQSRDTICLMEKPSTWNILSELDLPLQERNLHLPLSTIVSIDILQMKWFGKFGKKMYTLTLKLVIDSYYDNADFKASKYILRKPAIGEL